MLSGHEFRGTAIVQHRLLFVTVESWINTLKLILKKNYIMWQKNIHPVKVASNDSN